LLQLQEELKRRKREKLKKKTEESRTSKSIQELVATMSTIEGG